MLAKTHVWDKLLKNPKYPSEPAECSFDHPAENVSVKIRNVLAQNPKHNFKKFSSRNLFLKMFLWKHKKTSLQTYRKFFAKGPKIFCSNSQSTCQQCKDHMILLIENNIRGGILSVRGDRYVKSDENKKILYKDPNSLYGWAMSENLPYD